MTRTTIVDWLERHQIVLYLVSIGVGAGFGWVVPGSDHLEHAIEPVIALLLFATFLAVPFGKMRDAFRDVRFLSVVVVLNFVLVPIVVFGLSRFVATNQALLVGVLVVLLTPCIDYVIVFAGLAGGAAHKLLAASPLLMLAQILLLPVYLLLFMGPSVLEVIDVVPFVRAFIVLIVIPLAAAALLQWLANRSTVAQNAMRVSLGSMVPLMMLTLAVVVASQVRGGRREAARAVASCADLHRFRSYPGRAWRYRQPIRPSQGRGGQSARIQRCHEELSRGAPAGTRSASEPVTRSARGCHSNAGRTRGHGSASSAPATHHPRSAGLGSLAAIGYRLEPPRIAFLGRTPPQQLSGSRIHLMRYLRQIRSGIHRQIRALREILSQ